ncbi:hypothetical protein BDV10DRAFT_6248 [Aspergillus recurvatus]
MKNHPAKLERLPGEIRNKIYSYVFGTQRVEISRYMDETTCNHYHLTHKLLAPRDPETQNLTSLPYRSGKIQTQLSVPFVSTLLYRDTLCLLYDCTQFVFVSSKCVKRFLDRVPERVQAVIKHVELRHTMYNEPSLLRHRELKIRSDKNWYLLCERISSDLRALRVVHVDMMVFDAAVGLNVGESWSLPLLALGRVGGGRSRELQFVKVRLRSSRFEDEKLREVEMQLEKEMTNPVAMQIREDERFAMELAGSERAGKVLRLVFD